MMSEKVLDNLLHQPEDPDALKLHIEKVEWWLGQLDSRIKNYKKGVDNYLRTGDPQYAGCQAILRETNR